MWPRSQKKKNNKIKSEKIQEYNICHNEYQPFSFEKNQSSRVELKTSILELINSTINLLGISVITKMPRRTWEERKDSKDEQTKSLGRLSTHVTSEDEQGKKEKQRSKTKQEKGKNNGLPWDLIKGFWGIIKSRIVTSTPTTIIFIIVIS